MSPWRAWFDLMRISNLPTCVSNVLVGWALADVAVTPFATPFLLPVVAVALLYVAGMALNDVVDAPRDARERAERPIPSGRVSRGAALVFAVGAMLGAVGILFVIGTRTTAFAAVLAVTIVLYDVLHARYAAAVVLMGVCRGLVYVVAASAISAEMSWARITPLAISIVAYIVLVTLLARREHEDGRIARFPLELLLPAVALAPTVVIRPTVLLPAVIAGVVLVAWLVRSSTFVWRRPPSVKPAVMGWLAGISLVDAYFLVLLDAPLLALAAFACFALTALGHRAIAGT